ncbi:MAG: ABC transporter ATP-binding protein [Dehalococcoidales bacterium]|nr:ABC transporter ATP-binding protein [Dehalococcoidales bacterium]
MVAIRLEGVCKDFARGGASGSAGERGALSRVGSFLMGRPKLAARGEPEPPRGTAALDGVDLAIRDGETMSVVGPSGCGKTTLLRVVAGLERPDTGQIYFNDFEVSQLRPGERGIGMVFQSYALYPNMRAKENLAFYFRVHHREEEIEERVRVTSEMLGVGFKELLDKKPPKLSPGQQQRVAIGRCIVREPTAFLFDEPLSNVDAKVRVRTRGVIKHLLHRFGITSLYVTHDQTEAVSLGDRLAVMREGRIEQVGTYDDLYGLPVNMFVAGFIGLIPISFLSGPKVGRAVGIGEGLCVLLPEHIAALAPEGALVHVGIRACDVALHEAVGGEGLLGIVEVVERLPSEAYQIVHLKVGRTSCIARISQEVRVKAGYVMRVDLAPERLYLFDGQTERTLWPRNPWPK